MHQDGRINHILMSHGNEKEHIMFALTLPKTLAILALAVAALATTSVAQAGVGMPQNDPEGISAPDGLVMPLKHPDLIGVLKHPDASKRPDIIAILKRAHTSKRPHIIGILRASRSAAAPEVLIGLGKSPQIIAILCRKSGGVRTL